MRKNRLEEAKKSVDYITVFIAREKNEANYVVKCLSEYRYDAKVDGMAILVDKNDMTHNSERIESIINMVRNSAVEKISYEKFNNKIMFGCLDSVYFSNESELIVFTDNSNRTVHFSDSCDDYIIINYRADWTTSQMREFCENDILKLYVECEEEGYLLQVNRMIINVENVLLCFFNSCIFLFTKDEHRIICYTEICNIEFIRKAGYMK